MRTLEVRRHSLTKKGSERGAGSYLSPEGVRLARHIGESIGPFELVIATPVPRTGETAIALGFAVDEVVDVDLDDAFWEEVGRHDHWAWEDPFSSYRDAVANGGAVERVGLAQRKTWLDALERAPEGGAVLAVSHGHAIETGLVTCFDAVDVPPGSLAGEGPFAHLEGFRCRFDGTFRDLEILRTT
jgi:broad specificity phosphatase PhoE